MFAGARVHRIVVRAHDGEKPGRRLDVRVVSHAHAGGILERDPTPCMDRLRLSEQKRVLLSTGKTWFKPKQSARVRPSCIADPHGLRTFWKWNRQRRAER